MVSGIIGIAKLCETLSVVKSCTLATIVSLYISQRDLILFPTLHKLHEGKFEQVCEILPSWLESAAVSIVGGKE